MSAVLNDRDAILQAAATRIVNPKNADILLQQSAPGFHVNAAGAADVASITVSATLVGLEGAVSWSVQGATLTNVTDREVTVTYANMQGSTAIVSASIMSSGERFAKSVVLATIQDGAPGSSAKTVKLTPSEQVFKISKAGANSPASITLTATGQNTAGTPSFTIPVGTATLTAGSSSAQKVLTFANMATDQVTVEVTLDGQKDRVTIYKVREGQDGQPGADGVVGLLTNETVTLPANSSGVVSSFSSAVCTMVMYRGVTDDSANWIYAFSPASASNRLSYTSSGSTVTLTGMAAGVDSSYVDITASKAGASPVTKRFFVAKSKAGASVTGARGAGQHYVVGSAWSDVVAQAACPGGPVVNDQVTISNGTVTYMKRWDGAAWNVPGAYLSGDLFVEGDINGSKLKVGTVEVRAKDGTPILTVGGLQPGFEAPGTRNADADYTATIQWEFRNSDDGWQGVNINTTKNADSLTLASNGDAMFNSPAISINGAIYNKVRARIRRLAGTSWQGQLFYHTTGTGSHGASGSYLKTVAPDPTKLNEWVVVEWDMTDLGSTGGNDWITHQIIKIRLDLGSTTTTDVFEVDWVSIGRAGAATLDDLGFTGDRDATKGADESNLKVGIGSRNLLPRNTLPSSAVGYATAQKSTLVGTYPLIYVGEESGGHSSWSPNGKGVVYVNIPNTNTVGDWLDIKYNDVDTAVLVVAARRYEASVAVSAHRCNAQLVVTYYNAAGTQVGSQVLGTMNEAVSSSKTTSTFFRSGVFFTVPSGLNISKVVLACRLWTTGGVSSYMFCSQWYMGEALPAQTVFSPWSPSPEEAVYNTQQTMNTLSNIASDNMITKGAEKSSVIREWEVIKTERADLVAKANASGVSSATYASKYSLLENYLGSSIAGFSNVNVDTAIDGATFRTRFQEYYVAKQALLNATNAASFTKAADAKSAADAATSGLLDKLSRTNASQLAATVTLATGGSLLAGTPTNGVYLAPDGLYCVQNGQVKVVIPISGDPTFAGRLTAAFGTLGKLQVLDTLYGGDYTGWGWPTDPAKGGFAISFLGAIFGNYNSNKYIDIRSSGEMFMPGFSHADGQLTLDSTILINPKTQTSLSVSLSFVNQRNRTNTFNYEQFTVFASISGASGDLKYQWSCNIVDGDALMVSDPAASSCTFKCRGQNITVMVNVSLIVTDASNVVIYKSIRATVGYGTAA